MLDILMIHGVVITMDKDHSLYQDGYVAIKEDKIFAVGDMRELSQLPMAKRVINAGGNAILPGLVDGHGHGGHCLVKTLGDHLAGYEERSAGPEDQRVGHRHYELRKGPGNGNY